MATQKTAQSVETAPYNTMPCNSFDRVGRATGIKATRLRQQWRDAQLIQANGKDTKLANAGCKHQSFPKQGKSEKRVSGLPDPGNGRTVPSERERNEDSCRCGRRTENRFQMLTGMAQRQT